jgi:hypothetical protein
VRELLVIADTPDPLADAFQVYAEAHGWTARRLSYADASLLLSIARTGGSTRVSPDAPIFLRLPSAPSPWDDDEARFHRSERWSLVWAAGALSQAPVVNRPDSFGLSARAALSTTVVRSRAGLARYGPETFSSHPPDPQGPPEEWWLERQSDRVTLPWTERGASRGPFRAARVRPDFDLLQVPVVGSRAFGSIPSPGIAGASPEICRALGLTFALVMWRWYPAEGLAEFARVNPHPHLGDLAHSWDPVAAELLLELSR